MALQFPSADYKTEDAEIFLKNMQDLESKIKADALTNSKDWFGKVHKNAEVVDALWTPMLKYSKDKATGEQDLTKAPSIRIKMPFWDGVWKVEIYDEDGQKLFPNSATPGTTPIDLRDFHGDYPKANYTAIVPTQLFRALNGDQRLLDHLKSANAVLVGGAALSSSLRYQAESAGIKVVTTYGMTETCGGCVYDGTALDGVEIEIRKGRICIKGSVLAASIALNDGWFETNDLGHYDNQQLVVTGRADDVIISGGENLSLNAVENSLSVAFPTTQFAAFSVEDPQWGQSLHVAVVGTISDDEIAMHLEKNLGHFAKPKGIHHMTSLPLLGIGKIDRKSLAEGIAHE